MRIYVDQQVAFVSCYEVVRRLTIGRIGSGEHDLGAGDQDLLAPAGVLHVDGDDILADTDLGDEPVGTAYERAGGDAIVYHFKCRPAITMIQQR